MSKSVEGSFINLTDDLETIKQRLAKVPTDSGLLGGQIPQEGGVANLFKLCYLLGGSDLHQKYVQDYKEKRIRYSELKNELAEVIYKELNPFQQRRKEFENNPKMVDEILEKSNAECRDLAEITMQEVREKMGLR